MTLKCPPGERTRPTTERVRESLFGMLAPHLPGARVLDLFAGAGTLGFEALSRGAERAVFVDAHPPALDALRHNLDRLDLNEHARIARADALKFLARESDPDAPFDVIIADPPYGQGLGAATLERLAQSHERWLATEGLIVIQAGKRDPIEAQYGPLRRTQRREYGETHLHFFVVQTDSGERQG